MKKIYLVCATGIATSTMLRVKIENYLREKGIKASINQYRVTELFPDRIDADVIVSTTEIPAEIEAKAPVISGLPLVTGVGEEEVMEKVVAILEGG